jgi:hypothetical protein
MNKKPKIKKIIDIRPCACAKTKPNCKMCDGTGWYQDYYYTVQVGKHLYQLDTLQ